MKQKLLILCILCSATIFAAGCTAQQEPVNPPESTGSIEETSSEIEDAAEPEENAQTEETASEETPSSEQQASQASSLPEAAPAQATPRSNDTPPSTTTSMASSAPQTQNNPQTNHTPQYQPPAQQTPSQPAESKPQTSQNAPSGVRGEVYRLVNEQRQKNGKNSLQYRNDLQAAADLRANEIIENFSHTRPNGTGCETVINVANTGWGENIAYGQRTSDEVMDGWMNSPGHKANILRDEFNGIAVGYVEKDGLKYWVQLFVRS